MTSRSTTHPKHGYAAGSGPRPRPLPPGAEWPGRVRLDALLRAGEDQPRPGLPQLVGRRAYALMRPRGTDEQALHVTSVASLLDGRPSWLRVPTPPGTVRRALVSPDGRLCAVQVSDGPGEGSGLYVGEPGRDAWRSVNGAECWYSPMAFTRGTDLWVMAGRPHEPRLLCWSAGEVQPVCLPDGLSSPRATSLDSDRAGLVLTARTARGTSVWRRHPSGAWEPAVLERAGLVRWGPSGILTVSPDGAVTVDGKRLGTRPDEEVRAALPMPDGALGLLRGPRGERLARLSAGRPPVTLLRPRPGESVTNVSTSGGRAWALVEGATRPARLESVPLRGRGRSATGPVASGRGPVSVREWARADDGTLVPMTVTVSAGKRAGGRRPRPALVTVYGGFGATNGTGHDPSVAAWVRGGRVHVALHVRGGGELGSAWHRAGTGAGKATSLGDVAACLRHLVTAGWTTPAQLVLAGASHGGFLAVATALREPSLVAGVCASAPLLDVVDLHRHGMGSHWEVEFGTTETTPEQRASWSPLHLARRCADARHLPAMLLCSMSHDERVASDAAEVTRLLRGVGGRVWLRDESGGHAGRPLSQVHEQSVAMLAFAAELTELPR